MEGRMNKYSQVSPERAKVWTEKSPKYHYNHHCNRQQNTGKVPVVYYLCRNRQLEHPHFMEVTLSSPDGLYLRDVIERLNVLRGRGMTSMYSWSCKRSYKNGFVWHDLCEDDLILPAYGNEYVLKGSELFEESNSGRFSPVIVQNPKTLPELPSSGSQDESSSSSSLNGKTMKNSQDDEQSPPVHRPGSSAVSPESITGKNSCWNGPLSLTQYKIYKSDGLTDASTQTEESSSRAFRTRTQDTCTRGVSTEDGSSEPESRRTPQNEVPRIKETSEICRDLVSPPPSTSSASSSSGRIDTLESLISSDARKFNSFRILEEEEFRMPSSMKFKPSNMLMQLISCGSVSVKGHSFGLIPTYKPKFSYSKFASPLFSTSSMLGEHEYLMDPRLKDMKLEDKEYFSASLVETNMPEEGVPALKRSSSYNAGRTTKEIDSVEKEEASSTRLKCIPRSIKATLSKPPKCESMRSPISEGPRISSDRAASSRSIVPDTPVCRSKRTTEHLLGENQSRKQDSSTDDDENVIKIEES